MFVARLISFCVCALVGLCALTASADMVAPPMPLIGALPSEAGITIQLRSDGCMKRDNLVVIKTNSTWAQIRENWNEVCEDATYQQFHLSWSELGLDPTVGRLAQPLDVIPVQHPAPKPSTHAKPADGVDEAVYGYLVEPDALAVAVNTGGCTDMSSFQPWVEHGEPSVIHLARVKPDHCELDAPWGTTLRFTWADLGVASRTARLANPVSIVSP